MVLFLGGTTAGTNWRPALIERGLKAGIPEEKFFNPHLRRKPGQTGPIFTPEFAALEARIKRDPNNLLLFYICPGVVKNPEGLTPEQVIEQSERVGLYTMFEIGENIAIEAHRTAVVLAEDLFSESGRPRKILGMVRERIAERHGAGKPPYFPSLQAAEDWLFPQLLANSL